MGMRRIMERVVAGGSTERLVDGAGVAMAGSGGMEGGRRCV